MNLTAKKVYIPLLLVEAYLLFTIWLLYLGPIEWPIENQTKFLTLISLYHIFFIGGYCLYVFRFNRKKEQHRPDPNSTEIENIILKNYWIIVFFAFICSMISHRNITHTSSYIPWDFFSDFYNGLVRPGEVRKYYASAAYSTNFSGNKFVTSLLLVISVFKYALLPIVIFLRERLSLVQKIVGGLVLVIPVITGISISLSAINFYYIFVIAICCGIVLLTNGLKETLMALKKRKFILLSFVLLIFFSFWQFYFVKSEVSIYQVVVHKQTPTSFGYLKSNNVKFKSDDEYLKSGKAKSVLDDFYEKLTVYLVQGYQGMSISLGEKFQTTYGLGHSVFLQRVADKHLGFNIGERTFQRKISGRWHESVYWHSAYSYFANDVSFEGVCLIMFILGFYLAMIFTSAIILGNFIAKLLLPLLGLLFLYIPANNQVFSFLETMSSFWILTALFLMLNSKSKQRSAPAEKAS